MMLENIFLESRFHIPKPTGMLRGFDDPMLSRLVTSKINKIFLLTTIEIEKKEIIVIFKSILGTMK